MRKHIYLHTSNLENAEVFIKDESFQPLYEYIYEVRNISPNEWGRFKTDQNYYHIILGSIRNDNCPWCGSIPNFVELNERSEVPFTTRMKFCFECLNCGSRGPTHSIILNDLASNEIKENIKERIKHAYAQRLTWDHDLVNPYEKMH